MKAKVAVYDSGLSERLTSYTVRQTAKSLNFHPETVRDYLRNGRIQGFRLGNRWRISHEVLAGLLRNGVPVMAE